MLKMIKWILKGMLVLVALVAVMLIGMSLNDARIDYEVSTDGINIPRFTAMDIPFDQSNDFSTAHPFAAGAVIDIDGDGTEELFLGGGPGQTDAVLRFENGSFNLIEDHGVKKDSEAATFGASVIDTDGDGRDDLVLLIHDRVLLYPQQADEGQG